MIDDAYFPEGYLNQLRVYQVGWPEWSQFTVYQTLVVPNATAEYKQGVFQYLPALAESWNVSSDQMKYTFNLRQGVKFSNGDPLNSYTVWTDMYGFYFLSGNSSNWFTSSYNLFDMSKASFGPSTIAMLAQGGVTNPSPQAIAMMSNSSWPIYVNGPNQLVYHLKAPFRWFLGTLIAYEGMIIDAQYVLQHGAYGTATTPNNYFDTHPVPGTGPYVISQVALNSYVKFTKNPSYWGANLTPTQVVGNPYIDPGHVQTVIVNYKPDDVARYTDLSTGVAQISAIESGNWALVQANPDKYGYTTVPSFGGLLMALALNTHTYPTNITAVRQAIVHAINYTDIAAKAFFGQMSSFVGPEYPAWKDYYNLGNFQPYTYNLTLAKQYLAKANITNMPTFLFKVGTGCQYCINTAQVVQADLAALNISVNIEVQTLGQIDSYYGSYNSQLQSADQIGQLAILGDIDWASTALTPASDWIEFVSNGSLYGNYALYYNPVVQKCVDAFTSTADESLIKSLCTPAQAQINQDAPYAWLGVLKLWYGGGSLVWDKTKISGFQVDPSFTGSDTIPIFNTVTFS